jgi:hypothetical protein
VESLRSAVVTIAVIIRAIFTICITIIGDDNGIGIGITTASVFRLGLEEVHNHKVGESLDEYGAHAAAQIQSFKGL